VAVSIVTNSRRSSIFGRSAAIARTSAPDSVFGMIRIRPPLAITASASARPRSVVG
jgi:hypothetical protein